MPPTSTPTLSPSDLGLPAKFSSWRPGQWDSIESASATDKRFIACAITTGGGKSIFGIASALLEGKRALYLTSTKSLQQQLVTDFRPCGLADIRGRQNYHCTKGSDNTCAEGRLMDCKDSSCQYKSARATFMDAQLASTNYSYDLSSVIHSEGVGEVGTLILDEAHNAIQEVCSAIEIRIVHSTYHEIYSQLSIDVPKGLTIMQLQQWADTWAPRVKRMLQTVKVSGPHRLLAKLDALFGHLERLAKVDHDWIVDEYNPGELLVSPLWPTKYTHEYLFRDIPRIILMSATLVPKTLSLLGIPPEETHHVYQENTFDPKGSPVYMYGSCRVDNRMSEGQWAETVARMDMLISRRLDRKGIIHPVSYDRMQRILRDSEHRDIIIAPRKANEFQAALREYLDSPPPRIFMSPSVTTGYDFPYEDAEYQILIKVPFIPAQSPVMKAREADDPEYLPYLTAQTIVQTCGRGRRAADDHCENFIMDQHAQWFMNERRPGATKGGYGHLFPPWFLRQVVYPEGPPEPPVSFYESGR